MSRSWVSQTLPLFLAAFLLLGHNCHRRPVFDADGIYFEISEEWVLQGSKLDGDGGRVRCKRTGLNATFEMTVSWYDAAPDPGTLLTLLQESLREEWVYRDVEFAAPDPGLFRGMPSIESRFAFSVLGAPYSGAFVIFRCSGRTICIYYQQADGERAQNAGPLERFSSSFRCSRFGQKDQQAARTTGWMQQTLSCDDADGMAKAHSRIFTPCPTSVQDPGLSGSFFSFAWWRSRSSCIPIRQWLNCPSLLRCPVRTTA